MSDWLRGPDAKAPSAVTPEDIVPGVTLQSPKGTRWFVKRCERPGRGASYLLVSEDGLTQYRSFQNVRTWRILGAS